MSTVHVSIDIGAPIERVWETIMDPHRLKDWVTIHRSISGVSDHPADQGAKMDQVLHIRGVSFKVHWSLVDVSPPNTAQWEGRGPAHSRAYIRYELTAKDDDGTTFEYTNEFKTPGGVLGNVASRVVVGAASEREANNSLSRLKQLLERG
jgi:uncharacterized protein YndB with AHSA1/START domain